MKTKRQIILSIRTEFLKMGFDLSEFTDDEIFDTFIAMASVYKRSSFSAKEASEAVKRVTQICIDL